MNTPEDDFKLRLKDPEYKRLYEKEKQKDDKLCQRTLHSHLKGFWRLYYKLLGEL